MKTVKIADPTIVDPVNEKPPVLTANAKNVQSNTTVEQDLTTLGQRRVNLIWESTQAVIAVIVTLATIYSAIRGFESLLLGNAFTLIIALYFVRQNHSRTGGVGGENVSSSR